MDIYFTSKNTGPTWGSDPVHLVYVGESLSDAIDAVGDFARYEKSEYIATTRYPEVFTALPREAVYKYVKYYMADGWWYSIVKMSFTEEATNG